MAKMASMQLRIEKSQEKTNLLLIILAVLAAVLGGFQVYFAWRSILLSEAALKAEKPQESVVRLEMPNQPIIQIQNQLPPEWFSKPEEKLKKEQKK
jgi:hypothetical protein